jgi:hypothetical protein
MICSSNVFLINNLDPKMHKFSKNSLFSNFKMICSSHLFFVHNPDPNPKKKKNYFGSTTLRSILICYRSVFSSSHPNRFTFFPFYIVTILHSMILSSGPRSPVFGKLLCLASLLPSMVMLHISRRLNLTWNLIFTKY